MTKPLPSATNQGPKPATEQADAQGAQRGADPREVMRMPGYPIGEAAELVEMQGLLRLTIPHLSDPEQDHAKRNLQSVLVAPDDGWNCQRHARQNKRNRPLAMILDLLGFHRRPAPFAEITCRFHLSQDGRFTQELVLPPGWRIVQL